MVVGGVSQLEPPLGDGDKAVVLTAGQDADDAAGVEVVWVGAREEVERRWRRGGAAGGSVDEDVGERPPHCLFFIDKECHMNCKLPITRQICNT